MEHVPTSLSHGRHLRNNRQVVYDEGDLVPLVLDQVLGVAKQAEASHVRGAVRVVCVHQRRGWGG